MYVLLTMYSVYLILMVRLCNFCHSILFYKTVKSKFIKVRDCCKIHIEQVSSCNINCIFCLTINNHIVKYMHIKFLKLSEDSLYICHNLIICSDSLK